jgi:carbamoyltransferase
VHDNGGYRFCEIESIYDNLEPVFKHYSTFWSEEESNRLHDPYWDDNNFYSNRVSIGQAFRTIARYCGFDERDAGKTMGLSAYGHPDTPVNLWNEEYGHSICSKDIRPSKDTTKYYGTKMLEADVAYNLQKSAEKHARYMIQKTIDLTGKKNICVSGGFFLNCVANYDIIEGINLYVDPIAHDGGLAIGSALLAYYENIIPRT